MAPKSQTAAATAETKPKRTAKPAAKTQTVKARTRTGTVRDATKTAPKGKATAKTAATKTQTPRLSDRDRMNQIQRVAKLRQGGEKWDAIAETTGLSLSALARIRKEGKAAGVVGFTR
jgi:hypothetical protein